MSRLNKKIFNSTKHLVAQIFSTDLAFMISTWLCNSSNKISATSCTCPTLIEHTTVCLHHSNASIVGNNRENGRVKKTGIMLTECTVFLTRHWPIMLTLCPIMLCHHCWYKHPIMLSMLV